MRDDQAVLPFHGSHLGGMRLHGAGVMTDTASHIEVGHGASDRDDSHAAGAEAAALAIASIAHNPLSALFVFTSARYDAAEVLRGVRSVIAGVPVLGATTAGEICNGRRTRSVTVAAIASPHLTVHCGLGHDVSRDAKAALAEAVGSRALQPFFDESPELRQRLTREGKSLFALLFSPGNTRHHDSRSYELLEMLKARSLGAFPVVGGSSADDWRLERNAVLLGSEVHYDGLLIAIVETKLQVGIALAHGFRPTGLETTVTEMRGQEMVTLDGQPAAEAMAKLVGTTREALEGKHVTLTTRRAIGIGDAMGQIGITVCTFMTPQNGVRMAQPVAPGTVLKIMEPDPAGMLAAGQDAVRKAMLRAGISQPALGLVNYCALRARFLGDEGAAREIAGMTEAMGSAPLVGFCSFGEAGLGDDGTSRHANASISLLVLGKELSDAARVALEAEQLRAELERKAGELEHRVAARTSELQAINEMLQREIARKKETEQLLRNSEARYRLLAEDLVKQKRRAEEANRSKSAFLANMSHELRTPLNAIIGFSDLIKSETFGPLAPSVYGEYIGDIHASGLHLLDLINDLLDLSKIEAGKYRLHLEPLAPAEVMSEVVRLMSVRIQELGIDFRVSAADRLGDFLGDRRAVKQILFNLLSNAFKFTPQGGSVALEAENVEDRLRIAVADTGVGMSRDVLARVGQPFEQAENAYTRSAPGTGLGLAVTKSLVELHRGELDIRSAEGSGTIVTVSFPLLQPAA
jgi:signal transduction histidine kinase